MFLKHTNEVLSHIRHYKGTWTLNPDCPIPTYSELMQIVDRNSQLIESLGFRGQAGHKLLIDVSTGWKVVPVLLAALQAGVCVIPVDPKHSPLQFQSISQQHTGAIMITEQQLDGTGQLIVHPSLSTFLMRDPELEDVMLLLYTSGTTGHPKGVMLTPSNIWSNVSDIADYFELHERERILSIRPLTSASSIIGELLTGLVNGCSFYVKERSSSPLISLRLMEEYRITIICATSSLITKLAALSRSYELSSLKRIVVSGEPLYDSQLYNIRREFHHAEVWNVYGLTEASPRVTYLKEWPGCRTEGCVGHPLRHVNLKIVDPYGNAVHGDKQGELLVSGPNVMKGYYRDRNATALKVKQGWLYTADLAAFKQGLLYIYGRKDEMLIRGGNNVHPNEIESIMRTCPGVREVVVVGEADHIAGMKVKALFEADLEINESDVAAFMVRQQIDSRLCPDVFQKVNALPRNAAGKLIRN